MTKWVEKRHIEHVERVRKSHNLTIEYIESNVSLLHECKGVRGEASKSIDHN